MQTQETYDNWIKDDTCLQNLYSRLYLSVCLSVQEALMFCLCLCNLNYSSDLPQAALRISDQTFHHRPDRKRLVGPRSQVMFDVANWDGGMSAYCTKDPLFGCIMRLRYRCLVILPGRTSGKWKSQHVPDNSPINSAFDINLGFGLSQI